MYKGLKNIESGEEKAVVVDNTVREAWNKYVEWLEKKGLKGSPSLDKDDFGGKMIDKYKSENPDTPISRDMIIPIQKDFDNYRKWGLEEVKKGNIAFSEGVNEDNFMKNLSIVDGIAGQRTTSFLYPSIYLKTLNEDDKVVKVENKGFATTKK